MRYIKIIYRISDRAKEIGLPPMILGMLSHQAMEKTKEIEDTKEQLAKAEELLKRTREATGRSADIHEAQKTLLQLGKEIDMARDEKRVLELEKEKLQEEIDQMKRSGEYRIHEMECETYVKRNVPLSNVLSDHIGSEKRKRTKSLHRLNIVKTSLPFHRENRIKFCFC